MVKIKELAEIDSAAKMIEYSNRVEYEMERYQKELSGKNSSKVVRDILQLETSRIEGDLESLKNEYKRLDNSINILKDERRKLEIESIELKSRYKSISEALSETLIKIATKNEEIEKYRQINDIVKKEIEDLELAITLEEGEIKEQKNILKDIEINHEIKEIEAKKNKIYITETAKEFDVKLKMRELVENNINGTKFNTNRSNIYYESKLSRFSKKHQYNLSFNLRKTISSNIH